MNNIMKLMAARHEFYYNNPGLGASDLQLLEILAIYDHAEFPLSVGLAMKCRSVGSPATNHRILSRLIENDFIEHSYDQNDIRAKYIHLTAKGRAYFKKLDKLMRKAQ